MDSKKKRSTKKTSILVDDTEDLDLNAKDKNKKAKPVVKKMYSKGTSRSLQSVLQENVLEDSDIQSRENVEGIGLRLRSSRNKESFASSKSNHLVFGSTGVLHRKLVSSSSASSISTAASSDPQPSKTKLNKTGIPIGRPKGETKVKLDTRSLTPHRPQGPLQTKTQNCSFMSPGPGMRFLLPGLTRSLQDVSGTPTNRKSKLPIFQGLKRFGSSSSLSVSPDPVEVNQPEKLAPKHEKTPPKAKAKVKAKEEILVGSKIHADVIFETKLDLMKLKQSVQFKAAKIRRLVESYKTCFPEEFLQIQLHDYLKMVGSPATFWELMNAKLPLAAESVGEYSEAATPARKRIPNASNKYSYGGARSTDSGVASIGKLSSESRRNPTSEAREGGRTSNRAEYLKQLEEEIYDCSREERLSLLEKLQRMTLHE